MTRGRLLYFVYCVLLLGWCARAFRADLAGIRIEQAWEACDLLLWAALLSLLNYGLRVLRWRFFFARLGHPLHMGHACLTYVAGFAFTLLPGKVGEMMRAYYYRDIGIPLPVTASAFLVERILDLLVMALLAGLVFVSGGPYAHLVAAAVLVTLAMLLCLATLPWRRLAAHPLLSRLPPRLREGTDLLVQALEGAHALLRPRVLTAGFLIGLVAWAGEGLGLAVIARMLPQAPPDWATLTGIYAIALIAGAVSFLPGGLGGTEAVMVTLLVRHGYTLPDALLLTLTCRLLTLWFAILLGWIAVAALRGRKFPRSGPA